MGLIKDECDRDQKTWYEWPYHLGDYTGEECEKCGRLRVCHVRNGKTRCEKCNWVKEEKTYRSELSIGYDYD